ncbi:GerAB/ArcD/ProY family transporter [Paenibacillus sp. OAS669]|uniref:GerAB/ArcD/ProY family transporter n=1 Tax=Paenibacillus sp. OAS669 TaxID=2663821 RepID=UPI00178B8E5D|nr:GerAB/ArcD/ProY family transporter [Paenibacillus sp. OAS669]MBE1445908.1 spore germination protein KB [Paenibacillus sp. OAS669]
MENAKMNVRQLFALIVLFEFGTAIVLPIGFVSQQSVWISILLALIGGVLLFTIYDFLYRQYPTMPLSGYIRKIFGKYVGWPVCLVYLGFFIYNDARVLRETGELLVTTVYDQTPLFIINALLMIAVIYVLYNGIEVLARTGEIHLLFMLIIGVLGIVTVLFSNIMDLKHLLPLAGAGWKPIVESAYRNILMFPFGEMISFATILPYLNKIQSGRKTGIFALICSGLILSFTHALEIAVLGPDIYSRSTFPLFLTISKINIADFLQRMDAIVILTLIINAFFKCAITCYAAMIIAADLFQLKKPQKLALPIGITILLSSMMTAGSWTEFEQEGKQVIIGVFLPLLSIIIPVLLLVVHLIRKRFGLY